MTGIRGVVEILVAFAGVVGAVAFLYYMCRTAFNWKRVAELGGFLFISGFIFYWLMNRGTIDDAEMLSITCKPYGDVIKDCNGWLFTTKGAYEAAEWIKSAIAGSSVSRGQAMIASAVVVMVALIGYIEAMFKGGLKPLVGVAGVMIATYIMLAHLSEIQTMANRFVDSMLSFGRYDPGSSYRKLQTTFDILKDMKVKFEILGNLTIESETLGAGVGKVLSFVLGFLFGCLSYANVVLYAVQTLMLVFIPTTLAWGVAAGSYDVKTPLRLVMIGAGGRVFVVAQMAAIAQLNITDNFGDLTKEDWFTWFEVWGSIGVVVVVLVVTVVSMFYYIGKLIFSEIFKDRARAFT